MSSLSNFRTVHEATIPSYCFRSIIVGTSILHDIKVVGAISLAERLPLYRETVRISGPGRYFCILDNTENHENLLSFSDIRRLDNYLKVSGITESHGVTVTTDEAYAQLVSLAKTNMQLFGLDGSLYATPCRADAERFILDCIGTYEPVAV